MCRDERGHIVVETVGTFIPLTLLIISILSLVNIVTVQARVHYALTQTAMTLSVYSYALEVTGVANSLTTLDNKSSRVVGEVSSVLGGLSSAFSGINSMTGGTFANIEDSISTMDRLVNDAKHGLMGQMLNGLIRPIIIGYLSNGDVSGEEYLQRFGVRNFRLGPSVLLDRDGNIKLTVQYEIDYTFGALPLPFGPTLSVTQTAITKAWLNGSGEGYW